MVCIRDDPRVYDIPMTKGTFEVIDKVTNTHCAHEVVQYYEQEDRFMDGHIPACSGRSGLRFR